MRISSQTRSFRIGRAKNRHCGFTLVELMVSLLIGLVIVLGATQLFMVSRQSFEDVESLSMKQSALSYSVDVLSRDIRRADSVDWDEDDQELKMSFSGLIEPGLCNSEEITSKSYFLKEAMDDNSGSGWTLYVDAECDDEDPSDQPLVNGFLEGGLEASPISLQDGTTLPDNTSSGLWKLSLSLAPVGEDVDSTIMNFQVMNRMQALRPKSNEPESEPGYDSEGNKLYPNSCYRGGEFDPNKGGCRI